MEELERRRGSKAGRLMRERSVRFEDEDRTSGGETKEDLVSVVVHSEGQREEDARNECVEEMDEWGTKEMKDAKETGYETDSSVSVEGASVVTVGAEGEGEDDEGEEEDPEAGGEEMFKTDSSVTVDGMSVVTEV